MPSCFLQRCPQQQQSREQRVTAGSKQRYHMKADKEAATKHAAWLQEIYVRKTKIKCAFEEQQSREPQQATKGFMSGNT